MEVILAPFERTRPEPLDSHFYGALYEQAVVPWICAARGGGPSGEAAADIVRRVARAVVHCYAARGRPADMRRRFRERCHAEYVRLTHGPVWPSEGADPVWTTFFE